MTSKNMQLSKIDSRGQFANTAFGTHERRADVIHPPWISEIFQAKQVLSARPHALTGGVIGRRRAAFLSLPSDQGWEQRMRRSLLVSRVRVNENRETRRKRKGL